MGDDQLRLHGYLYQAEPHSPFLPLPQVEQRLPALQLVGRTGKRIGCPESVIRRGSGKTARRQRKVKRTKSLATTGFVYKSRFGSAPSGGGFPRLCRLKLVLWFQFRPEVSARKRYDLSRCEQSPQPSNAKVRVISSLMISSTWYAPRSPSAARP